MTRVEFLNELYGRLGALEKDQAQEWLVYYAEMLADRMEEGMTEEEAVASMEDLDTIAGRILQEAGLPPEVVGPPRYPDPPAGGGGGTGAYAPPRRTRLNTFLWVVAAVAVVLAVVRWVRTRQDVSYPEVPPDTGIAELRPGDGQWDYTWEGEDGTVYIAPGYGYENGEFTIYPREEAAQLELLPVMDLSDGDTVTFYQWIGEERDVRELEEYADVPSGLTIRWEGGSVAVCTWEQSVFAVQEEHGQMSALTMEGGRVCLTSTEGSKDVTVFVPSWWSADLDIRTGSAGVDLGGATYGVVRVTTDSGDVALHEVEAQRLEVETDSGDVTGAITWVSVAVAETDSGCIDLSSAYADALDLTTDSGDVCLSLPDWSVSRLDLETDSGSAVLVLQGNFSLRWKTDSGRLLPGPFELEQMPDSRYVCGTENLSIDARTGSGDLELLWLAESSAE